MAPPMIEAKTCVICGTEYRPKSNRQAKTSKCCSYQCLGKWHSKTRSGTNHPAFQPKGREPKECQQCGKQFSKKPTQPITTFRKQKFCSKDCADKGGIRHTGTDHPNWVADRLTRRNQRRGKHGSWARAVISRDKATCQHCGATDRELHAHHIKEFSDYPELRWELDNGLTLCCHCHWKVHSAENDNGVNSGEPTAGKAGGNPEPSLGGNILEGVTTNGRAYRRWNGSCHWCGAFISKRLSDIKGKAHLFCSSQCMGKHRSAFREYRPTINPEIPDTAVIPTRAPCP